MNVLRSLAIGLAASAVVGAITWAVFPGKLEFGGYLTGVALLPSLITSCICATRPTRMGWISVLGIYFLLLLMEVGALWNRLRDEIPRSVQHEIAPILQVTISDAATDGPRVRLSQAKPDPSNPERGSIAPNSDNYLTDESIGIETLGGVFTPLIPRGYPVPAQNMQIFSTAHDNQPFVEVHLLGGEGPMVKDCRTLLRAVISGIPPQPRGVPKVQVVFSVDRQGLLTVTAIAQ